MTNDLISRNELLEKSMPAREFARNVPDLHVVSVNSVRRAPAVDAAPVVHGRWIPKGYDDHDAGGYICSECGDERYFGEEVLSSEEAEHYCHYCPNCGAKMDKEVT